MQQYCVYEYSMSGRIYIRNHTLNMGYGYIMALRKTDGLLFIVRYRKYGLYSASYPGTSEPI
jgi:hypothetical protein